MEAQQQSNVSLPLTSVTEQQAKRSVILVVEDNPINCKVASLQLKQLGVSADMVNNGLEAVQALEQRHYELVLMDCQMPVMDGFEATQRIRAMQESGERKSVIVAVTAHAMVGDREKCLAAGMDDYVAKPLQLASLSDLLARWIPSVEQSFAP